VRDVLSTLLLFIVGTVTSQYLWDYFLLYSLTPPDMSLGPGARGQMNLQPVIVETSDLVQHHSLKFLMYLSNLRSLLVPTSSAVRESQSSVPAISLSGVTTEEIPDLAATVVTRVNEDTLKMNRLVEQLKLAAAERGGAAPKGSYSASGGVAGEQRDGESKPDIGALWKSTLFYGLVCVFVPIAFAVFR